MFSAQVENLAQPNDGVKATLRHTDTGEAEEIGAPLRDRGRRRRQHGPAPARRGDGRLSKRSARRPRKDQAFTGPRYGTLS